MQGTLVRSLVQELKIPHALGQLNLPTSTREASALQLLSPCAPEPVFHSKRSLPPELDQVLHTSAIKIKKKKTKKFFNLKKEALKKKSSPGEI